MSSARVVIALACCWLGARLPASGQGPGDEDGPEIHYAFAESAFIAGNLDDAEQELEDARRQSRRGDAGLVRYYALKGTIVRTRKTPRMAERLLGDGIKLANAKGVRGPLVADLYAQMGLALSDEGNDYYAVRFLKTSLTLSPAPATRGLAERRLAELDDPKRHRARRQTPRP